MSHSLRKSATWRAPSHLYQKKTPLWYTHVAVFFFAIFLLFMAIENWIGLVAVAVAFWFFLSKANDKPKVVDYKVDSITIQIEDRVIHYEELGAFAVEKIKSSYVIELDSKSPFTLPITLVVKPAEIEAVTEILLGRLPQKTGYSFMRQLTHWLHY